MIFRTIIALSYSNYIRVIIVSMPNNKRTRLYVDIEEAIALIDCG